MGNTACIKYLYKFYIFFHFLLSTYILLTFSPFLFFCIPTCLYVHKFLPISGGAVSLISLNAIFVFLFII